MAKAAAPYLHPRLSNVEHAGDNEAFRKAVDLTDDELAAIASRYPTQNLVAGGRLPLNVNIAC